MTLETKRAAKRNPVARAIDAIRNKYDAAGAGKRMASWTPPSSGPNWAMWGLQKIRDRSRDAVRNDWTGETTIQKWTTNLIGIGIRARITRDTISKTRKQFVNDLWDDFCNTCDADGILSFYGMQTLAVRAWLESGEVFIRKRPRSATSSLVVPLQIQLIEADYVPLLDADTYPGMPAGNRIRSGIELDSRGQRVAYWMYREHPGERTNTMGMSPTLLIRILASEVKHMFMPVRPGQLRGVSSLAPILAKLRDIGNYEDAVLLRQQIANLFVAFIKRTTPAGDPNVDPLSGQSLQGDYDNPLMPLKPGLIQELDDGQEVQFGNPPEAGTTFSDYMRTEYMGLASASGIPYEIYSGDLRQISDRTLRVLVNEFRRFAEQRQWQVVIPMFCQPAREWFTVAAAAAGLIALDEVDAVKRVEWSPQGWAYIHPVQDPQGKKIEIETGFRSRSSVISERGDDPETVDQERAKDVEREKALGIFVDPTGQMDANGKAIPKPAPVDPNAQPDVPPKGNGAKQGAK